MTTLPAEIQRRIDQHLDAIDAALATTGMPRSERAAITGDVQGQIEEMLASRTQETPAVSDVEAILAELDPPEAYRKQVVCHSPSDQWAAFKSRFVHQHRQGRWARRAGFFLIMGLMLLAYYRSIDAPSGFLTAGIVIGIAAMFILAILFVAIAISKFRQQEGRMRGFPLALFLMVMIPILVLCYIWLFRFFSRVFEHF